MRVAQSSHLQSYEYDEANQVLTIQFQNGSIYSYSQVPAHVYYTFVQNGGGGTYFWSKIRGQYPTARIA